MIVPIVKSVVTGLASMALFGSMALESYVRLPQKVMFGSTPVPLQNFTEDSVFLIFPGYGGPDLNTERIETELRDSDKSLGEKRFVYCYDWSQWRGNLIRAAFDGQRVGKLIGEQLGCKRCETDGTLQVHNLHVVGISVGAFAADMCIKEYKRQVAKLYGKDVTDTISTRLTLLDPFTSRGVVGQSYGPKYFGLEADYFEHYLNTDDPVPFTNDPLPNAYTYDVTNAKERNDFVPLEGDNMHSWPVAFFGLNWKRRIDPRVKDSAVFGPPDHKKKPRGTVIRID